MGQGQGLSFAEMGLMSGLCHAGSASLRIALGYIPGALFVGYVAPAVVAGGPMQWVGGQATVVLMLTVRDLSVAVLGGTAAAWAWWVWA